METMVEMSESVTKSSRSGPNIPVLVDDQECHGRIQRRGQPDRGSNHPPLKNHPNMGFLSNTGPDPLKIHIATKPAFNVGPSSAR